jgi:hypothetical protein
MEHHGATAPNRELIQQCLTNIAAGESIRSASANFDLSECTVRYHKKAASLDISIRINGGIPSLHPTLSAEIAAVAKAAADHGFGLSKKELRSFVSYIVNVKWDLRDPVGHYLRQYCRFVNRVPGDDWIVKFMRDNNLSLVKPSPLERSRALANADPHIVYGFYDLLHREMERLEICDKPHHVFNLDETAFFIDPSRVKVVAPKGKSAHRITAGPGRQAFSVMLCVSADGKAQPPLVIFPGKHLYSSWQGQDVIKGTMYGRSESGWMTTEIFTSWFDCFISRVTQRPLLLIFDGHKTHLGLDFIHRARAENVTVIKLPSHTTSKLQPLDVSCFRPIKNEWDNQLIHKQRLNGFTSLSKSEFVDVLSLVLREKLSSTIVQSGFRKTGIFPLDSTQFSRAGFNQAKLLQYEANLINPSAIPSPSIPTRVQVAPSSTASTSASAASNEELARLRETIANLSQQMQMFAGNLVSPVQAPSPSTCQLAPSLSQMEQHTTSSATVSQLFFDKFAYRKPSNTPAAIKRRRINQTAAVITHDDYLAAIDELDLARGTKVKRSRKKTVDFSSDSDEDTVIPPRSLKKMCRGKKNEPRMRTVPSSSDSDPDIPKMPPPLSQLLQRRGKKNQPGRETIASSSDSDPDIPKLPPPISQLLQRAGKKNLPGRVTIPSSSDSDPDIPKLPPPLSQLLQRHGKKMAGGEKNQQRKKMVIGKKNQPRKKMVASSSDSDPDIPRTPHSLPQLLPCRKETVATSKGRKRSAGLPRKYAIYDTM